MADRVTPAQRLALRITIISASVVSMIVGTQTLATTHKQMSLDVAPPKTVVDVNSLAKQAPNIVILRHSPQYVPPAPAASAGATTQGSTW